MFAENSPNQSPLHLADQGPTTEAWNEEIKLEIECLSAILNSPVATEEQKAKAQHQIAACQDTVEKVHDDPADWLRQMQLLAE